MEDNGVTADPADYEAVFMSPAGQRVLEDLWRRYHCDGPSMIFDKLGQFNLQGSAKVDACKEIIRDIHRRALYRPGSAKPKRKKKGRVSSTRPTLPSHTNSI
jgi:hypothetical protein